jgi:hypothetical protein
MIPGEEEEDRDILSVELRVIARAEPIRDGFQREGGVRIVFCQKRIPSR